MKPSEKRALEAEKRRLTEEEPPTEPLEDKYEKERSISKGSEKEVLHRTESFFSNHVKLITFLIVGTLVFIGFAFGIDMFVRSNRYTTVTDLEDMTLNTVYAIHDNADNMKWQHFKKYNYTDYSYEKNGKEYIVREYPIADSDLVLKVGGSSVDTTLDYAQLTYYGIRDDIDPRYVDVLKTDPHDFVKSIVQQEEKE